MLSAECMHHTHENTQNLPESDDILDSTLSPDECGNLDSMLIEDEVIHSSAITYKNMANFSSVYADKK